MSDPTTTPPAPSAAPASTVARDDPPAAPAAAAAAPVAVARPFPFFAYALLALLAACVTASGLALLYWLPAPTDLGTVTGVRLTAKPGIDLSKIEDVLDTPDYYLELRSELGSIRTPTKADTPVGSGLTFQLPVPVRLADVREVIVWDENSMGRKDAMIDRIDNPARKVAGGRFNFDLLGTTPPPVNTRQVGLALAWSGGVVLALVLVRFVHAQVV